MKINEKKSELKELPFISVIMPVHNEENFIEQSLVAVLRQNYPHDQMEVIVADGMSTDQTLTKVSTIAAKADLSVRILTNINQTAATGLNLAISKSKGEIIVRVDGHTVIEPFYVRECVSALERSCACNVGGAMTAFANNIFGQAIAFATSSPFGVGNARFHYSQKEEFVDTVYLGAWRREVFEKIGLFNEELGRNQDDEFNYRLRASGGKILLSPKIKSRYYNRSSWRSLCTQYYRYGFWKVRVMQLHPGQMRLRQFIPLLFVTSLIISAALASFNWSGIFLLGFVMGTYLLSAIVFSLKISARQNYKFLFLLPVCFLSLHLSYGFGFLNGLFYFWNFWLKK